jgi:tRNA A-37 threonylcarbamoyl transferase component Bud32
MALPKPWIGVGEPRTPGGQGDVFQVRKSGDGRRYALKRLKNPKRVGRFVREVRATEELHDEFGAIFPEIVESGVDQDERPYYVMPWLPGSLQVEVDDKLYAERIPDGITRLVELSDVLSLLHSKDWAHRDLKPANVLTGEDGGLVLADLGLAMEVTDEALARLTPSDEAVGSRYYIAPENEDGASDEVDQRPCDFYAFGKIVWVLLLGRRPLSREAQLEAPNRLANVLTDQRLAAIDDLCDRLLDRDPRSRLTDWDVVRAELSGVIATLTEGEPREQQPSGSLAAAKAAALAFRGSPEAFEIDQRTQRLAQRMQAYKQLTEAAFSSAQDAGPQASEITEASGGHFQVSMGSRSHPPLGIVRQWLRQGGYAHPVLEVEVDAFVLGSGCAVECGIDCLFTPPVPSIHICGWIVLSNRQVWMLQAPILLGSDGWVGVAEPLIGRLTAVEGPFHLGLKTAVRAARRLGDSVCEAGVALAPEYVGHVRAGHELRSAETWLRD